MKALASRVLSFALALAIPGLSVASLRAESSDTQRLRHELRTLPVGCPVHRINQVLIALVNRDPHHAVGYFRIAIGRLSQTTPSNFSNVIKIASGVANTLRKAGLSSQKKSLERFLVGHGYGDPFQEGFPYVDPSPGSYPSPTPTATPTPTPTP